MARPTGDQERGIAALLALLIQLSNRPGWAYCRATNTYLAKRLGKSTRTISRYLSILAKRGQLQVVLRRRKSGLGQRQFTTSRYCRPISASSPRTWAPSPLCSKSSIPVENVVVAKPPPPPAKKTSWAAPLHDIDGVPKPPQVIEAQLEVLMEKVKNIPKPKLGPQGGEAARIRLWRDDNALLHGDSSYYRRFN